MNQEITHNDLTKNLEIAIRASIDAGKAILKVYDSSDFETVHKKDDSPLTKADKDANEVILSYLKKTQMPIISEENKTIEYHVRKNWELCWMVDPLDGTKEFIKKNGEFTVNIALISKGEPILGVIYAPVTKELYFANVKERASYKVIVDKIEELPENLFSSENQISAKNVTNNVVRVVGSRSHMNDKTEEFIRDLQKKQKEVSIVSKGSSFKFCLVAEGKADVYPRFAPTMEWDTAAGHAICKALGYKVENWETKNELTYNKENLLNPFFLVH
ncbi:3'(2'),5'-bisphosphate nucleotidase CysQ [Flagellimonas meishanensis]|uniref:3'(2'),5'-bisphosphate nucleotidase CysQ n=1 Tax=Flagellimonas meishanensis TaxID=2873264 RepID=UPI001CA7B613|nr:3'(2'),5'-bisphosphate nucleotidase CysQ [[Muricauda] meishanensis]